MALPLTERLLHSYLAYDPGITPKDGGLPGLAVLKDIVSSINLYAIIAVVGSLSVSLIVWAWGHHSGGHQTEANGKKGFMVSCGVAIGLGAANGLVVGLTALGELVQ
ncbi:DUF6112 family protein [Streptomyces sp. NPDC051561]|uniref:DUF6112 family protein n=1 Tax=Streptomyces sp. NPDC051561 TaxID=3365658 RepID=UPI0037A5C706